MKMIDRFRGKRANPVTYLSFESKDKLFWILQIVKYSYSALLILFSYHTTRDAHFIYLASLELIAIVLVSNFLLEQKIWVGYLFNYVALFVLNAQMVSLLFRGSFISLLMIENIHSIQALRGNFIIYIPVTILTIGMTCLPITSFKLPKIAHSKMLVIILAIELLFTSAYGTTFSVFFNSLDIISDKVEKNRLLREIEQSENYTAEFYSAEVADYTPKPDVLPDRPNIILIFTEGLSQNIIRDERNIMPTISDLQNQSLSFSRYYNHTFATYRGLISQLYSGYQLEDNDINTLTSLQSLLSKKGYHTYFLNSEPNNRQFTEYLNNLGFDDVLTKTGRVNGTSNTLSDKESYELLFEVMEEKGQARNPFLLGIYTFGTHLSLDSPDERYGDGSDPILNKFYNVDYQFKQFLDKFNQSSLADNSIIVFTTDHATAVDSGYKTTFPNYERISDDLDEIPLIIYHKGVEANTIDVGGRNSIDLVPTILDYIDVTSDNYFLGESLFAPIENRNLYDTIFYSSSELLSSEDGNIQSLSDSRRQTVEELMVKYFAAKQQIPLRE